MAVVLPDPDLFPDLFDRLNGITVMTEGSTLVDMVGPHDAVPAGFPLLKYEKDIEDDFLAAFLDGVIAAALQS